MEILARDTNGNPTRFWMWMPDDEHQHLRQGAILKRVAPMVAKRFGRAIIMPNLDPPVVSYAALMGYDAEIEALGLPLKRLMTFYLTDTSDPADIRFALERKEAVGVKYYPRGLTTNSDKGVKDPFALWTKGTRPYQVLQVLAELGGVLLLHAADGFDKHGEELDPYDQEKHFLKETLPRIIEAHPNLKISVEHMSTAEGTEVMRLLGKHRPSKIGCSLTAHHLLLARKDVFRGGFRPHRSWMPVIQPTEHQQELRKFAAEDHPFVWLGSDSAPHPQQKKESDCCASGVLMAHAGIELYVEAFEEMGALDDRFERFASINGPAFYGLPPNQKQIELVREEWTVDSIFVATEAGANTSVVPFRLGEKILWKLVD